MAAVPDVLLAWHAGNADTDTAADSATHAAADADEHLRRQVSRLLGASPDDAQVRVGRLCPECGSGAHGRPWARYADREVHVSLSRAGGHLVTAVSVSGPVGVDIEVVADVATRWPGEMVLAPGEADGTGLERARTWVAKEAVLKRRGSGLAVPMRDVRLADETGVSWLEAPPGLVGALAV